MANIKLTTGAVSSLMQGGDIVSPVLQILGFKKIAGQGGSDRYRLNISDGINSHSFAMLATQLNNIIPDGKLDNNAVIRADKLISNAVSEKRVLIILELTVLAKGTDVRTIIGSPVPWKEGGGGQAPPAGGQPPPHAPAQQNVNKSSFVPKQEPVIPTSSFYGRSASSTSSASTASTPSASSTRVANTMNNFADISTNAYVPIKDITPYNSKICIRVRVTNKTPVKTYSNSRGDGKLFSIDLIDESGEIRMAGFNNSVDTFYEMIEPNSVYFIRNFSVKNANKQFTTIDHDYELSFNNDTQVYPCLEAAADIPNITFNFCDIASLEVLENNAMTDCIGICKRRGELQSLTQRSTGKELQKRDLFLVDKTNKEITLTLWGKQAEDFNDDSQPVVAIKGAKVSDFNGKSLSMLQSSIMQINPDIREAHILRGWFDNEGVHSESKSLSTGGRGAGGQTPWKVLREANAAQSVDPEKGEYFMSKCTIVSVRRENFAYQACPSAQCNKKIVNLDNGMFRCEKCSREYPDFKWRLMVSVNFADYTDNVWATCFQEASELILGQSAATLGPMSQEEHGEFDNVIKECLFKNYIVKFRSKMDSFNNETRIRTVVQDLHKVNFAEYAKKLSAEIKESI